MFIKAQMDLTGKVAVVTGGTGYLGSRMSEALCELGATVYAISRGKSQDFTDNLQDCGQFIHVQCDMSKKEDVDNAINMILSDEVRGIEILVNNSYSWPKISDFMKSTWDGMSQTLEVGLVSQLYVTKLVFERMIAARVGGNIINVSSMYGHVAPDFGIYRDSNRGNAIEYGASKAALAQATKYIASIGGKHGIRCNSISPGPFPRPGTFDNGFDWFRDELARKTMLNRHGQSYEIKGAIAFLASDLSSYVTGIDLPIDGGWRAW